MVCLDRIIYIILFYILVINVVYVYEIINKFILCIGFMYLLIICILNKCVVIN